MSYIDELTEKHGEHFVFSAIGNGMRTACSEVDSLRLQLACALETGVKSMSMGEAELRRELAKALEDAERAKGEREGWKHQSQVNAQAADNATNYRKQIEVERRRCCWPTRRGWTCYRI